MKQEKDRSKLFTRRAALLWGGNLALFSGLTGRMYWLQIVSSDNYKMLAEDNRISLHLLPPVRGVIVDRNGITLARNADNYRVNLIPEQADKAVSTTEVLTRLARLVPLTEYDIRRILKEIGQHRAFVPVTVRENLSWEEFSRISVNTPDLPGIDIKVGQSRHYPYGEALAHVLGYVAAVTDKEIGQDPLLELPGFRVGRTGIEKRYELPLRGKGGTKKVEVNALGREIRELERNEGQPGHELQLSLDARLQAYTYERIADQRAASVVVMDGLDRRDSDTGLRALLQPQQLHRRPGWRGMVQPVEQSLQTPVQQGHFRTVRPRLHLQDSGGDGGVGPGHFPRLQGLLPRSSGNGQPPLPLLEKGRARDGGHGGRHPRIL